jgi:CCR4-NOT transcriptional regulation complex NOT5 subunit
MVEFSLTINKKQRTAYFNKKIIDALGYDLAAQLNATSGILYPKEANKSDVIRSVEIILEDLKHQAELEEKKESKK